MFELKLEKAGLEQLGQVLAFIDEHLEEMGCPLKTQMQIDIAVEEVYVNIANYAYAPETGPARIQLEPAPDRSEVTISFFDRGSPFDPLAKEDPDITLSAEERQIGGLGIYMVKQSMDNVHYIRENDINILIITKKL